MKKQLEIQSGLVSKKRKIFLIETNLKKMKKNDCFRALFDRAWPIFFLSCPLSFLLETKKAKRKPAPLDPPAHFSESLNFFL